MKHLFDSIPDQTFAIGPVECKKTLTEIFDKAEKVVLFTGRHSADTCGAAQFVAEIADESAVELFRWKDIPPEPDIKTVLAMRDFLLECGADTVCAAGGGSVLDAAKAALLLIETNWDINDLFGVNCYSSVNPACKLRRIVAIPMTSGTGSEATQYANIVDRENNVKRLIAEKETVPEYALLNSAFTETMPDSVTLATACDALSHLLEGFLNTRADSTSGSANYRAIAGIRAIVENLPLILKDSSNTKAREALSLAAALGGSVIRFKSTGLPHLCSFSWFGRIEHGMAVAMLLPAAWQYYLGNPDVCSRTMELAQVFPGNTPEEVINSYKVFLKTIGVPPSLAAYPHLTPALMAQTAKSAGANKMKLELAPRPVPLDESEKILSDILTKAYKGE